MDNGNCNYWAGDIEYLQSPFSLLKKGSFSKLTN